MFYNILSLGIALQGAMREMILAQGAADEGVGKKMCSTVVKLTRKRLQKNIKEMYS